MAMTRKRATELAREGLAIRNNAIVNAKKPLIGFILEGSDIYVCTEQEYSYSTNPITIIDVSYDDTIGGIASKIYNLFKK